MNYQGVVWQEFFLRMSLRQRRAAALATESEEATVAGLESYILNSVRMHGFKTCVAAAPCTLTKIRYLRGRAFAYHRSSGRKVVIEAVGSKRAGPNVTRATAPVM
jgi:hypothetical protein